MSDAQPCPHCGDTYDDNYELRAARRGVAQDGDFGVCVVCLGVYIYEAGAFGILFRRLLTDADKAEMLRHPCWIEDIQKAKEHIVQGKKRKLTPREWDELKATRSEQEWDNVCDRIKAGRDGAYPTEWFMKVIATGFLAAQQQKWKQASNM